MQQIFNQQQAAEFNNQSIQSVQSIDGMTMNTLATCGTTTTDPNRFSPSLRQITPTQQHTTLQPSSKFRNIPKHQVMANNPIVRTVNKILSTADALRNSNTIDVVNEAVANILPQSNIPTGIILLPNLSNSPLKASNWQS